MRLRQSLFGVLLALGAGYQAQAQPMLYAQHLPEGTVYIRLANALPGAAAVKTDFAGTISLGSADASRISPYFVAGNAGGKAVALSVTGSQAATVTIHLKSGVFVTVVLHDDAGGVAASVITDKPEYNQLKARLAFYNLSRDCSAGSLTTGGRTVFSAVPTDAVDVRSLNPVDATVTAACRQDKAKPLDLGKLQEGGLYSVWLMRLDGQLRSFVSRATIAPPQS